MINGKIKLNKVVLALGGNKGNVNETFKKAIGLIKTNIGLVSKSSSLYKTAAWGVTNQPDFINQIIVVETKMSPTELLGICMKIETLLGRTRNSENRWKERVIDIDILFYNNEIILLPNLEIPHPEIENRKFILVPLVEILPNFIHPKLKKSIKSILNNCSDTLKVVLIMD